VALASALAAAIGAGRLRAAAAGARGWIMLVASVAAVYWLQPSTPIRHLDFWLPTAALGLTCVVWAATRTAGSRQSTVDSRKSGTVDIRASTVDWPQTAVTAGVIVAVVMVIDLARYAEPLCCLTPSTPPQALSAALAIAAWAGLALLVARLASGRRWAWLGLTALLIGLFVILKTDPLTQAASALLRTLAGQPAALASPLDLRWLGFSYLAFRLIHVLRDRATGRLPALELREFVAYAVFFPSLAAGPIDRAERFARDFRAPQAAPRADVVEGAQRIAWGVLKKFAVADTLALIALNGVNAAQTASTGWTWALLYAYAFRLYFDFSGYTDIAIGLGRMFGIRLPENFDRPYLKPNLTAFWNSWHMTLANWFRAYAFNPLTRALRSPAPSAGRLAAAVAASPASIILIGQTTTMLLIGLWHGVTPNFALWGLWQALGLFIHNRWLDYCRRREARQAGDSEQRTEGRWRKAAVQAAKVAVTFHFVALGWVWFALPNVELSLRVYGLLIGVQP
jgi:D-alanyl-lipoteichoic acid acyltransferase DltB (MBOAT superfamily)